MASLSGNEEMKSLGNTPSLKQRLFVPILLLLLTILAYQGSFSFGLFSDDFQGVERYQRLGFSGLFVNYENPFFMPFSFLFQAAQVQWFGHPLAYKITSIILFWACAVFLYLIAVQLYHGATNAKSLAFFTALLFVFSPYQTEAVLWFSSQAYLLAGLFSLWALWLLIRPGQHKLTHVYFGLLLFLALMNKEIALVVPGIALCIHFAQAKERRKPLKNWALVTGIVLGVYFFLRYWVLGSLIGGYGAGVHANFSPFHLISGCAAYCAKFFSFYRYMHEDLRKGFAVLVMLVLLVIVVLTQFKNQAKHWYLPLFLFLAFIISLIPVLNLETSFLENVQSDRYGFFPGIFFLLFFSSCLTHVPLSVQMPIQVLWLSLSVVFLINAKATWKEASEMRDHFLLALGRQLPEQEFYLLNAPDNLNGVYIFRHGLQEALGRDKKVHIISNQFLVTGVSKGLLKTKWDADQVKLISNGQLIPQGKEKKASIEQQNGKWILHLNANILEHSVVYYFEPFSKKMIRLAPQSSYSSP